MYIKCGGVYPTALEADTEDALEEYLLKIFKRYVPDVILDDIYINHLEFFNVAPFGLGVDLQLNTHDLVYYFINEKDTPEIYDLYRGGWCEVNVDSDISVDTFRSFDAYGGTSIDVFDYGDNCPEADYDEIDKECEIIDNKIINILRENNDDICNFLLQYEIPEDYDDGYYE